MVETDMANIFDELKRAADAIKATADAITAVEEGLETFARSATLEVRNATGRKLFPNDNNHDHGGFSAPPDGPIEPKSSQVYGTRSSGLFTGTAGRASWNVEGTEIFLNISGQSPSSAATARIPYCKDPALNSLSLLTPAPMEICRR
jgi:hypothetical protein